MPVNFSSELVLKHIQGVKRKFKVDETGSIACSKRFYKVDTILRFFQELNHTSFLIPMNLV